MAKLKKNNNFVVLLTLGIVVFVLLKGAPGLFSFITTCDNIEPLTMTTWENYANLTNTTIGAPTLITVPIDANTTRTYNASTATIGTKSLTLIYAATCPEVIADLAKLETDPSQTTIMLSGHDVIIMGNQYYWCNKNDMITMYSPDITAPTTYYSTFEVCTTTELNESQSSDVQGYLEGTSTINPVINNSTPAPATTSNEKTISIPYIGDVERNTLFIVAALVLIILYLVFEAGPDKGFFKGKKK